MDPLSGHVTVPRQESGAWHLLRKLRELEWVLRDSGAINVVNRWRSHRLEEQRPPNTDEREFDFTIY